jgi:3-oxoadipate enol-lactonase
MPTLALPGVTLNYAIDGPAGAPVLVLSNSLASALQMWEPQVAAFSARYRLLRYDARGHGASSVPPAPYTLADLGRDVLALLDALDVRRAHFCGISMGGMTGMWLGAHAAGRIGRLVLCDTSAWFGPPGAFNGRIELARREGMEPLADATMARWFTPEYHSAHPEVITRTRARFLATPVEGYAGCCAALRDADEREHLARIQARTLVIGGTFDPAPTLAASRALADAIPGASFVELPAAHLSNLGAAAQFNAAVLEFLGRD